MRIFAQPLELQVPDTVIGEYRAVLLELGSTSSIASVTLSPDVRFVTAIIGALLPALSMMIVERVPALNELGPVFGVPLPVKVIPTGIDNSLVQMQVPAGIIIVSPFAAVCVGPFITALTEVSWQDAALIVVPPVCPRAMMVIVKTSKSRNESDRVCFMIDTTP